MTSGALKEFFMTDDEIVKRCMACSLHAHLCLCALIPRIESATKLVLLIHQSELRKTTNTGMLAARCLVQSEVHVIGEAGRPLDHSRLFASEATQLVLFPTPDAVTLASDWVASLRRPIRLIVPDGHWGQAAKIQRKLSRQANLHYVTLPDGPPSAYGLRRPAKNVRAGLSTLEAIARALAVLEGPKVSAPLDEIFRTFVARTLAMRGTISRLS